MVTETILIGLVVGLVQLVKQMYDGRFIPLVALALGVGLSLLANGVSAEATISGLTYALVAMGLWSGSKAVLSK